MTATISEQHATTIHDAVLLGGNNGLTLATIAAMVRFTEPDTERYLLAGVGYGIFSRVDGRWVAWDICRTCGHGINDDDTTTHPSPAACETDPGAYVAGYPLPHA